jgi:hypothetical protein
MKKKYKVGDILKSEDGYFVVVFKDSLGELYGSLICSLTDSCRDVPYSLDGKHTKIINIFDKNET